MKEPKKYCPYCELELHETGHVNEAEAWHEYGCEFNPSTHKEKEPITELFMVDRNIKDDTKRKSALNRNLRELKKRKLELESIGEQASQ